MPRPAVRRASPSDLQALLSLYDELAGAKVTAAPADAVASAPVLERILSDPTRELVVAVTENAVVGTADMAIVLNLTHRAEPWAIVENVVVSAAHRRRGVGRALMEHLIAIARAAGCHRVELLSGKHRVEAHELYRSVGLVPVAEGFKLYFDEQ